MRTPILSVMLVAVSLALGASACGDDSDESNDASAAVIEQIDASCSDWKAALDERGAFPVEEFDPENPGIEDLRAVGDYFASGQPAQEKAIAELRALSPPADVADEVESFVSALESEFESARVQTRAAQAGDVAAFIATLDDAASSQEAVKEATDELGGGESCAF